MLKLIAILFFIGENKAQIVDILAKNSANKSKLQKLQDKYKKKHDKVAVAVFFISYPSLLIALHYAVDFFGTQTILSVEKLEMLKFKNLKLFYSCELDHCFALSRDLQ